MILTTRDMGGDTNDTDLNLHISELINRYSILKEYKKVLRTKIILLPKDLKGDRYGIVPKPRFETVVGFSAWIQTMVRKNPEHYVLTGLPSDESEKLWIEFHTNNK